MSLKVREMKESDISSVVDYFVNADADYLKEMGADKKLLPSRTKWISDIFAELHKPMIDKDLYYIIWVHNGEPIGHSNINKIKFGKYANIHLHMWRSDKRRIGFGLDLLKLSIPYYFEKFGLDKLICEPYNMNSAPTKVIESIGFEFIKAYETIPGTICFRQTINRYDLTKDRFYELND